VSKASSSREPSEAGPGAGPDGSAAVDEYIGRFPANAQIALQQVRQRIHAVVPGAGEAIRYDMPTITVDGRSLIHFAGWKHHLSLYPVPDGVPDFEQDIAPFRSGRSTARFHYAQHPPAGLIERLVALQLEQRGRRDA
jgi:uncharacterized protein YdhG (YjbR/CyaY superfamily)